MMLAHYQPAVQVVVVLAVAITLTMQWQEA
jgi:hypothetical protein